MSYLDTATHKLTVAAIYTPAGAPIVDVDAVHAANCTQCAPAETTPHTCTTDDDQDHTPQHLRNLTCPRCAELREHYATR